MYLRTGFIQPLRGGYPKGTLRDFFSVGTILKTQDTQMTLC